MSSPKDTNPSTSPLLISPRSPRPYPIPTIHETLTALGKLETYLHHHPHLSLLPPSVLLALRRALETERDAEYPPRSPESLGVDGDGEVLVDKGASTQLDGRLDERKEEKEEGEEEKEGVPREECLDAINVVVFLEWRVRVDTAGWAEELRGVGEVIGKDEEGRLDEENK